VEWQGCDPNAAAIAWAREHLPGARFALSDTEPPLPYPDASFALVYAISIWSHFDAGAALRWLGEIRRVLEPGGLLMLTAHGYQSVAVHGAEGARPPRQLEQIRRALYRRGFWYAPEFGDAGDHGVSHPEWGTAFLTPEWLLRYVTAGWRIEHFGAGQNAGNQDVYVLARR
jgi:SAM-dependent methyltransferase